jgi:hypothetical protein
VFSKVAPEAYRAFQESGKQQSKCSNYVEFVIEKLYELDEKRNTARSPQTVTLHTKHGCPFCAEAKKDLEDRGMSYQEISIDGNPKAIEEVMCLSHGNWYSTDYG